jgi:uncharacterized protein (DUF1778 family)
MAATVVARSRTINIRIEDERRSLIDRAAAATGKDRTQRVFQLDKKAFAKFSAALDAPHAHLGSDDPCVHGQRSRASDVRRHGFAESPVRPMTLMITVTDVERALRGT